MNDSFLIQQLTMQQVSTDIKLLPYQFHLQNMQTIMLVNFFFNFFGEKSGV